MTEWETTKIKGDVKADAKEVDATYTEIMEAGIEAVHPEMDGENEPVGYRREDTARNVVSKIREEFGLEGDVDVAEVVSNQHGGDVEAAKDEIIGRLDDLEARLPRKVGEELKGP